MMDFITFPVITGILTLGVYKLFELFARRKERNLIIEKTNFADFTNRSIDVNIGSSGKFGAIRIGCLLAGMGLGLIIAFIIASSFPFSGINELRGKEIEIAGIVYGACTLLFGGIGLVASFIIERKYWDK